MHVGWPGDDYNTCEKRFIERLTKAIWYIDPHLEKLRSRGCHLPLLFSSLPVYQQNGVYNEYYQRMKKKKSQLTRLELFQLANSIELSLTEPWASKDFWQEIISNVFKLTSMMKKYFDHLENINNNMKALHESENPAREPSTNCNVWLISKYDEREINSRYHSLDSDLTNRELFNFIDLNLHVPDNPIKKYDFIHNIQLSVPKDYIGKVFSFFFKNCIYPHGNYLGTLNFIWREPDTNEINEDYETLKAQMIIRINDIIPVYYTRQMRKNVFQKYSLVRNLSKPVLRMLYYDLTDDALLANDKISKEMEERLRRMMLLEDPSIIIDLRINNGFQGSKFDIFWDELNRYFNEHNNTVVNERRTGATLYIPYAISIQELQDRIITRLNAIYQGPPLPSDVFIPSEEWIRLNFASSNAYTTKALQYTGRFNVKYKVQSRLLRKSTDDKHKVPIGEGVPVSTGVRNKKTLAPAKGEITATDHDFTKLSLTPSVTLFINIPCDISESFYDGKVYISFKDAVFQPSSALRHSTEFFSLINRQYCNQPLPSILSLYTDGGPDHRCTFGSVQVALIYLFLTGNFDMLIAVRTAPHHSWCNPAERIMSVINYGLQGVAIEREKMPEEYEDEFKILKTLEDIREKAKDNLCLKAELEKCIVTVQELLCERTEHLVWKNEAFEIENPAFNSEIDEMFKIKKCNQPSCEVCYPIRMPIDVFQNLYFLPDPVPLRDNPDYYETFANLYGKPTTEKFCPSLINLNSKAELVPSNILISAKIRGYIKCNSCGKTRCLYSESRLTEQEKQDLESAL
ncbi:hypothetical protein GLOIN_2v1773127 [Rhizophagus clarus]|uniref:Uncharacterized protein n=1 Tax=Rhizophagus clarus TaxID=94130 RepID=A0A8H3KZU2_9GLOM|nr:hypothetical protein GLOIN_2v1773127 [Rhizophagus clarus]